MKRKRVLFLCTANASRSQMSEAIARLEQGDIIEPYSAGSHPAGWVHPLAVRAMKELGADLSRARSKPADEFKDVPLDLVVTVCDSASADCPLWPSAREIEHWSVVDPSFGPDDPATRFERFLETRDELRGRIARLAERLRREADGR